MTAAEQEPMPSRSSPNLIFAIIGLGVITGLLYWGFSQDKPWGSTETAVAPPELAPPAEPEVIPESIPTNDAIVPAELSAPVAVANVTEAPLEPTVPVITLAESDTALLEALPSFQAGAIGSTFLQSPNAIERCVAIVDNLRQGAVPYKLLPVGRPQKAFPFTDDGLGVTLDPSGFSRYDGLATAVSRIDVSALLDIYKPLKPAIEEAWAMLGYPDGSAEEALLEALGQILTAPDTDFEARLIKREANWIYEDPALEALPALHKQLMRMGPTNARAIQDKARELRSGLLDSASK